MAPGTKPMGPGTLYVKAESTAFTWEAFAATDAIRHFGVPAIGGSTRERTEIDLSRGDRGRYHEILGRYPDVPFSFEIPFYGSGTAGTAVAARKALFETGAGLSETVVGGTSVTYESDESAPTGTISMYYVDRDSVVGTYLEGGIVQQVGFSLNKSDAAKYTISGLGARLYRFRKTTLGAELDSVAGTTSMTIADTDCILSGNESSTSLSGLEIYVKIDSEIIKITAFNRSTGVATIVREQFSTSAATHSNASVVTPYNETPTYGEAAAGGPLGSCDWTASDGSSRALVSLSYTLETGRMYDQLSSGNCASSAVHNARISGSGSMEFILNQGRWDLLYDLDVGTEKDLAIVVGSTAGNIHTINLDHARLIDSVDTQPEIDSPKTVTVNFRTRDTATALAGQFQLAET